MLQYPIFKIVMRFYTFASQYLNYESGNYIRSHMIMTILWKT